MRDAVAPPVGYVPLEMPELWEPPAAQAPEPFAPAIAESVRVVPSEWRDPSAVRIRVLPTPGVTHAVPRVAPADAPRMAPVPAPCVAPVPPQVAPRAVHTRPPRSLAELRDGALAGRSFESLQQLAVAAVLEAGYSPAAVGRLFRVPAWRVEEWIVAAQTAAPARPQRIRR